GLGMELAVIDLPGPIARHDLPDGVLAIPYDARKDGAAKKAFARLGKRWGGKIDGFIHLPGYMTRQVNLDSLDPQEFDEGISVNLRSAYLALKEALPMLRANGGGAVLLVASGLATLVEKGTATYSAAKAGIIGLTKSLGKETARTGIRVNCVTPAAVKTPIFEQVSQQHIDYMLQKIPMGRFGLVEEIASMVCWLCTEDASFTTGGVFDLSGGRATY
ncbi:MAG: SDR family oxidoreductase, partial [Burkholderiales bacterium]|nr:SDR family oxidoreductase [Burkholderiales bacterium]